ncbi:hypothetical protein FPOAC1_007561 [Fusarium poae]|uniref:hypothetical protein n=1 Tax=Fusarium poae TaxID=36050 RepID=UPI001CE858F5|nr:hypothetical protein FPOAC1_007561 [Fusarium poae]KAG8668184.1 hypothetical protein FPOAC1_007561 [Fusarium poae]
MTLHSANSYSIPYQYTLHRLQEPSSTKTLLHSHNQTSSPHTRRIGVTSTSTVKMTQLPLKDAVVDYCGDMAADQGQPDQRIVNLIRKGIRKVCKRHKIRGKNARMKKLMKAAMRW